jgi:ankyrin repeat protein
MLSSKVSNGQTLLYIACKEGKVDIVSYFLNFNPNLHVKNFISENETEDCLSVALRWNYKRIVEVLLRKGDYSKDYILDAVKKTNNKEIKAMLKLYLKDKLSRRYCCF